MEHPPISWYLPGKMGVFMGYVSFREGVLPAKPFTTVRLDGSKTTRTITRLDRAK